jgi:hypothetical protein
MMEVGRHKVPEEFGSVLRAYAVQRARLTAPIGWTGRGSFHDYITDYHVIVRELQWQRFCVEIRDGILTTLGNVFGLLGSWRDERPRLVWDQLPTIQQVERSEELVTRGSGTFDDVLRPFRNESSAIPDED